MTTTTNIDSNATGNEQPGQTGPTTTKQCTCHKFIRLHDGDCDVHGRVRKQLVDEDAGNEITLSNFRVEYVKPDYSRGHSFEPRCAILADDAALGGVGVRVFDVPDPDESQREVAEWACGVMNAALVLSRNTGSAE